MKHKLMKPREVAEIFKVGRVSIYRWFWEGKLKGIQIGRTIRIFRSSVEEYLNDKEDL